MQFIPRNLRAQSWIVDQETIERLGGRSACKRHVEGAFRTYCRCRGLNELLRRPAGFESLAPRGRLLSDDSRFIRHSNPAALVDFFFADAPDKTGIIT